MKFTADRSFSSLSAAVCGLAVLLLTLAVTAWVYAPGVSGPSLLDDRSSVLVISDLRASPELALDFVFGDRSGPLGRPVSMASFVLESLYSDDGTVGSKRINIVLHLINGLLVVWLFSLLYRAIDIPASRLLAIVTGAGWLLSPLLVSTVLYIVQRMAILSTLFMLAACIAYVYWRLSLKQGRMRIGCPLLVLLCGGLAVFAKENAIVLLPILLLMEALWFQFKGEHGQPVQWLRVATLGLITAGSLVAVVTLIFSWEWLAGPYQARPFTLNERLLTEARIVWDYVGQLVWPDVVRMGLYHDDVVVSESLVSPFSTLVAVLSWLGVLFVSAILLTWQWGRYLVFAIAWFLVGHSTESTVLSLELYFEHRNYFPGIGLFLATGVLFGLAVKKWPEVKKPLLVYLCAYVLWLASQTSSQVQIWSSQPLLVFNHLNAHPNSFRANTDMAVHMANLGDIEAARKYSARAFEVDNIERRGDYGIRDLALSCIVNEAVPAARIDQIGTSDANRPLSSVTTLLTMVRLLQDNVCPQFDRLYFADRMAAIFLADWNLEKASANIYSSLAVLENTLQRYDKAYEYTQRFLALSPDNTRALLMKLHFTTALGRVKEAQEVKTRLQRMDSEGKLTVGERQTLALYLGD